MRTVTVAVVGLHLLVLGCGDTTRQGVDQPNGGFDFSAEDPLFGPAHQDSFVSAGEASTTQPIMGPAITPTTAARTWAVWTAWGHLVADRDEAQWTDWNGQVRSDVGTLTLERTLAFDRHDQLLAPPDERTVAFESRTRPHFDGLVTRLESDAANPVFTLDTNAVSLAHAPGDVPQLQDVQVPGTATSVVVVSIPLNAQTPCAHVLLTARWASATRGNLDGRLVGRVFAPQGTLLGHWRGFTGTRRDGTRVLFGKAIDPDGNALALLQGSVTGAQAHVDLSSNTNTVLGSLDLTIPAPGSVARQHAAGVATMSGCL